MVFVRYLLMGLIVVLMTFVVVDLIVFVTFIVVGLIVVCVTFNNYIQLMLFKPIDKL